MNSMMKSLAVSLGFFIPISTFMTNIVLALLLILWSRWSNIKKLPQLWRQFPVLKGVAILLGVLGLGCLYSVGNAGDILYSLKKSAKLLAFFILLPLFSEKQWRLRACWAFLAAVGLTLLLAVLEQTQAYDLPKHLFHVEPTRPDVFKDSLYTALLVAMGTFVAAQLLVEYRTRRYWSVFLSLFIALGTYSLFWINTGRSGQVIFIGLWCLFSYRVWRISGLVWGGVAIALIAALAWVSPSTRFAELWMEVFYAVRPKMVVAIAPQIPETAKTVETRGSTEIRLNVWRAGLRMMQERPWFGWGTGSFQQLAAKQPDFLDSSVARNPHNQYLNIGIQQGFFGLCVLFFFFGLLLKNSWQLPPIESGLLQGILLAMVIGCLGNSWLTDFTSGYLFIWLASISVAGGNARVVPT
jgi:O-antigen ligase